jgi:hypothetical protein
MNRNLRNYNTYRFKNYVLTNSFIKNIIDDYKYSKLNVLQIASKYNTSKFMVYRILQLKNTPTRLKTKLEKEKVDIKKIPKFIRSYLAGVIDGEGYIYIVYTKSTQNYLSGVYIKNTDKKLLDFFAKYFGGNVTFHKRAKPNHKDSYQWVCNGLKAAQLCRCVLPYLIIKRKQAELLLDFSSTLKKSVRDNYKLSESIEKKRKMLISEIKILNKRGVG